MKPTAVGAGLLVAFVVLAAVAVGGIAADATAPEAAESNASAESEPSPSPEEAKSMGADVSSFMQASSADTESQVDERMFHASLNRTEDSEQRQMLIEERKQRLLQRHERLEQHRASVSTDEPSAVDYALAARVSVGAANLERSANRTAGAAEAVGIDTEDIADIRSNARQLRDPDADGLVRGVAAPPSIDDRRPVTQGADRSSVAHGDADERPPQTDNRSDVRDQLDVADRANRAGAEREDPAKTTPDGNDE